MTINDLARVLRRAADIAEKDLEDRESHTVHEWAAYKLLRWLSDGACDVDDEDRKAPPDDTAAGLAHGIV